ncbi:hypothetical protein VTP01DRAFT_649 [Rhizomucor pusillus]|uniref:uncharacterized protein n=1 Tax=Rhizomucor pusillus TaxID=4840 RepID=UPI0037430C16
MAQAEQVHTKDREETGAVEDTKVKDSSVSNVENSTNDKPREKRRIEREESDEEEELDEFGRVKRRRQKFSSERDEEDEYEHHHRRYSYRPRSPSPPRHRRHHRSSYYPSDSEEEEDRRRRYSRRPSYGSTRHYSSHRHSRGSRNPYENAGRYIDTDFHPTKIYIGDLEDVSVDSLERTFKRFGHIVQVKVVEGKDFGFVTYEDKESALDAIQAMDGALFGRRHIRVNRAKLPERNQYGFGNIPWTDEDGNFAKEEMQTYPGDLDAPYATPSNPLASSTSQPTIDRPLTTYDDL